jgi:hypothetical protein
MDGGGGNNFRANSGVVLRSRARPSPCVPCGDLVPQGGPALSSCLRGAMRSRNPLGFPIGRAFGDPGLAVAMWGFGNRNPVWSSISFLVKRLLLSTNGRELPIAKTDPTIPENRLASVESVWPIPTGSMGFGRGRYWR